MFISYWLIVSDHVKFEGSYASPPLFLFRTISKKPNWYPCVLQFLVWLIFLVHLLHIFWIYSIKQCMTILWNILYFLIKYHRGRYVIETFSPKDALLKGRVICIFIKAYYIESPRRENMGILNQTKEFVV